LYEIKKGLMMNNYKKLAKTLLAIAFSGALFSTSANAVEEKVLNVYNWVDYIGENTIANFEKETGIKVNYQTYEENETLDKSLRIKKDAYDVVVPSTDWSGSQINSGLLMRLDKSKIPNFKNLDPSFIEKIKDADPSNAYLAGYLWGYTTIGLNVTEVVKRLGSVPVPKNLWELVFNPDYTKKLKSCGIIFLDSPSDVMPIALAYIGKPAYSENPADYAAAAAMLNKVRSDIKEFSGSEQAEKLASRKACVMVGWGADFYRARSISKAKGSNLNIAPVFPEKGGLLFFDTMAIPANAKHPDNAHKFINYILRAEVHASLTNETKYANPNLASKMFIDIAMVNDRALMISKQDFNRLTSPKGVSDKIKAVREEAFESVKSNK
jgi:putrescine transport system substrate-binding protein